VVKVKLTKRRRVGVAHAVVGSLGSYGGQPYRARCSLTNAISSSGVARLRGPVCPARTGVSSARRGAQLALTQSPHSLSEANSDLIRRGELAFAGSISGSVTSHIVLLDQATADHSSAVNLITPIDALAASIYVTGVDRLIDVHPIHLIARQPGDVLDPALWGFERAQRVGSRKTSEGGVPGVSGCERSLEHVKTK
jgi:hypothetical protein